MPTITTHHDRADGLAREALVPPQQIAHTAACDQTVHAIWVDVHVDHLGEEVRQGYCEVTRRNREIVKRKMTERAGKKGRGRTRLRAPRRCAGQTAGPGTARAPCARRAAARCRYHSPAPSMRVGN